MAENSRIQWTDATFNPWRGCTKVSAGCANCYAEAISGRNPKTLGVWGPSGTRVVAAESAWREPVRWNRLAAEGKLPDGTPNPDGHRPRVFCASLADVFERPETMPADAAGVIDAARTRLLELIRTTPRLDWLLLTKRPHNVTAHLGRAAMGCSPGALCDWLNCWIHGAAPSNVWLGASVENQAAADERLPHLLATPAAVRFLSMEPLLGPVNLNHWLWEFDPDVSRDIGAEIETPAGTLRWVIVGGESGPGARPMAVEWVRGLVAQCKAARVPVFVKQLGARPQLSEVPEGATAKLYTGLTPPFNVQLEDKKGGDPSEWPEGLRVRQFPATA